MPLAPEDTKRLSTTVSFPVVQFNAVKKQFVATRKVPIAVIGYWVERTFAVWSDKLKMPSNPLLRLPRHTAGANAVTLPSDCLAE